MFIGREKQLQELQNLSKRESPGIAVIYGRRRIGKTSLIAEALKGKKYFSAEGLENEPTSAQLQAFLFQIRNQFPNHTVPSKVNKWYEVFQVLYDAIKNDPMPIVLDEFQWMGNYRKHIVSSLKLVWDQSFSKIPGVSLILCGSIASFMTKNVIRSTALYGRVETVIHLRGFSLSETADMLPGRGIEEILEAQLFYGGVPQYVKLAAEAPSIHLSLEKLAFSEQGFLFHEYERIFTSHFGNDSHYEDIVRALADHAYGLKRKELIQKASFEDGGNLSKMLRDLEASGFIGSQTPFHLPESRHVRYYLADAFLRFYFTFIRPNKKRILSAKNDQLFHQVTRSGAFHHWLGHSFEHVCLEHGDRIAKILGFCGIEYTFGPWFQHRTAHQSGAQIDLAYHRSDGVIILCEMKHQSQAVGKGIVPEVEAKVDVLRDLFPKKTIFPVLVTSSKTTRDLESSGYFYRTIQAEELLLTR